MLAERVRLLEVLLARGERISASEAESARRLLLDIEAALRAGGPPAGEVDPLEEFRQRILRRPGGLDLPLERAEPPRQPG